MLLGQYKTDEPEFDEFGEPYPIAVVPGESEPIRSDRAKEYFNDAFWFYLDFYMKCRHNGRPFGDIGWTNEPQWIPQLIVEFDTATKAIENYNIAKSSGGGV